MFGYTQSDQAWHHVRVNVSIYAPMPIVSILTTALGGNSVPWDAWITNAGLLHADGSFTAVSFRDAGNVLSANQCSGNNTTFAMETASTPDPAAGATYFLSDHLGTAQIELASGGWPVWQGQFAPFGQELDSQNTAMRYKFTGKERDTESGLDYFGARYYASNMGRFMSPDPLGGHMTDPQTLNKYSYVRNNPLIYTDPTGLDLWLKGCKGKTNCNHGYVGTWDADHKHFTRTHITDKDKLSVTMGNNGVKVQVGSNSYQGVWDTNKGEGNTVTAMGTGDLSHFDAKINGDCGGAGGPCNASGYLVNHGTNDLAKAGDVRSALTNADGSAKSGWMTNGIDIFHTDPAGVMTSFNGIPDGAAGQPSTDVTVSGNPSASTNFHVNSGYPFEDAYQFTRHSASAIHGILEGIGVAPKHD